MISGVPLPSTLELSKFMRGVVGVFGVYTFGDLFVLDIRWLGPSGVVGLRALDHPARFGSGVPILSAFAVDVVGVGVPRVRVVSVLFARVSPWSVSAAVSRFRLLLFGEGLSQGVAEFLGELFIICFRGGGTRSVT